MSEQRETFGCVWADGCDFETADWDELMRHSWTHRGGQSK
jgi:hypothetical protein